MKVYRKDSFVESVEGRVFFYEFEEVLQCDGCDTVWFYYFKLENCEDGENYLLDESIFLSWTEKVRRMPGWSHRVPKLLRGIFPETIFAYDNDWHNLMCGRGKNFG